MRIGNVIITTTDCYSGLVKENKRLNKIIKELTEDLDRYEKTTQELVEKTINLQQQVQLFEKQWEYYKSYHSK